MNTFKYFSVVIVVLTMCAPAKQTRTASTFSFAYDGHTVLISSVNEPERGVDPYNIIRSETLDFVAVDYNRDMTIDKILRGTVTVNEVQAIYDLGLDIAMKRGVLRKRDRTSIYEYKRGRTMYVIKSHRPLYEEPYNEFIIAYPLQPLIRALDRGAEGRLDDILEGRLSLNRIQGEYHDVIDAGMQQGRITESEEGRYTVQP